MSRKLRLIVQVCACFAFLAPVARAQGELQRIDVFGGLSYEQYEGSTVRNIFGAEVTGQWKLDRWVGIAADLDAHFGRPSQLDARNLHFMVGPQFTLPARFAPFVHVLAGVGHAFEGGGDATSASYAVGGGLDVRLAPLFSWRIIQADDLITHFFGSTQNSPRISTGIVLHF